MTFYLKKLSCNKYYEEVFKKKCQGYKKNIFTLEKALPHHLVNPTKPLENTMIIRPSRKKTSAFSPSHIAETISKEMFISFLRVLDSDGVFWVLLFIGGFPTTVCYASWWVRFFDEMPMVFLHEIF